MLRVESSGGRRQGAAMGYDAALVERVRRSVSGRPGVTERAMFGGIAFLLDGKMFCGAATADLMVRVGPEKHEAALARPHVRPMDFTGRPMRGYVFVGPGGTRTRRQVEAWVEMAINFVATVEARPRSRSVRKPLSPATAARIAALRARGQRRSGGSSPTGRTR